MNELQLRAVLSGVLFGIWPLVMNRSGLNGNVMSMMFALGCLLGAMPFALPGASENLAQAKWTMFISACVMGTAAFLIFNGMIARATPEKVGALFVLNLVMQITAPALYHVVVNRQLTASKAFGFVTAIVAAFLLMRK